MTHRLNQPEWEGRTAKPRRGGLTRLLRSLLAAVLWPTVRSKPGLLTLEGTIFIALAFLIGLAATNTGTNLLYLIFSLMVAFLLVSGFLCKRTLKKLRLSRSLPKHIVAGEQIDVRVALRNQKRWFASYGLLVTDHLRDGTATGDCYFLRVTPKGEASVSYPCVFHRRGLYQFARLAVSTTYPFGFVRRTIVVRDERDVLVYPQILPWSRLGLDSPPDFGEKESRRKGHGTSLYGLREQLPGEGARWIHWKKTAQTGRLMRREFEAEEKKNVCLVLDNGLRQPDDPGQREAFEHAIVLTASVAHHLLQGDHQVELITRSGRVPYNFGPHQRYRILRALALIEPVRADERMHIRLGVRADTATVVFRCDGHAATESYPRGTQVIVVSPPSPKTAEAGPLPKGRLEVVRP